MRPGFVHSERYDFRLRGLDPEELSSLHAFDGLRAQRAWALFLEGARVPAGSLIVPREVRREELELVHDPAYLDTLDQPARMAEILEVPLAAEVPIELLEEVVLAPMRLATGGTILATRAALERGLAVNLGGGYHHARPTGGEGFCVYNDLAVAIEVARRDHGVERVLVADLDAHQGNGVEWAFLEDEAVAVLDAYNSEIYPQDEAARAGIRWELRLATGASGPEYLERVAAAVPAALDAHTPELLVYNAGTDIVAGDPLGLLEVSEAEVLARDLLVLEAAARRGVPVVVTPSGGYTEASHRMLAALLGAVRERWM